MKKASDKQGRRLRESSQVKEKRVKKVIKKTEIQIKKRSSMPNIEKLH